MPPTAVIRTVSVGVYITDELTGDQRGLTLRPDPPPLLPPLLLDEE